MPRWERSSYRRAWLPCRRVRRRRAGAWLEHGPRCTAAGEWPRWDGALVAAGGDLVAAGPAGAPPTVSERAAAPAAAGPTTSATVTSNPSESGRRRALTGAPRRLCARPVAQSPSRLFARPAVQFGV